MKRLLKCGISLIFLAATCALGFLLRVLGVKRTGTCTVLYYHSIPPDQRAKFAQQLDVLLRYAKPICVADRVELESGMRYVGVTFDDGFANFVEVALPELARRNIPSTVFVVADALGKAFGPNGHAERVMSIHQLQQLPNLVTIGSHTSTHPFLPSLNESDARRELVQSRKKIEEILKSNTQVFSFPFGGFDQKLVDLCRQVGYRRVFTTLPYLAFEDPDEFVVGRVRVDPKDWSIEFRLKLAGAYRWLPTAFSLKRRLFLSPVIHKLFGVRNGLNQRPAPHSRIQDLYPKSGKQQLGI